MENYDDLKLLLRKELADICKKGSMNMADLDAVYKMIDVVKDLHEIEKMESEAGGYSERGGYARRGYAMNGNGGGYSGEGDSYGMSYDNSYYDNHSYAGGYADGKTVVDTYSAKRDSMGRYSRTGAKQAMVEGLYKMMGDAGDEKQREAIQECIKKLNG